MKERITEIVAAYVGNNTVAPDQLPALIANVSQALSLDFQLFRPPGADGW